MKRLEILLVISAAFGAFSAGAGAAPVAVSPAKLHAAAEVSPRFLSYNIEMASIVGAAFWSSGSPRVICRYTRHPRQEAQSASPSRSVRRSTSAIRCCAALRRPWGRPTCGSVADGPTPCGKSILRANVTRHARAEHELPIQRAWLPKISAGGYRNLVGPTLAMSRNIT